MAASRFEYAEAISKAINAVGGVSEEDNKNAVQALLLLAATIANSMSPQTVGCSLSHIEESAVAMAETLNETFGVDV